jgi:hypothetical protein
MNALTVKGRGQLTSGTPEDITIQTLGNLLSLDSLSANFATVSADVINLQNNQINKYTMDIGDNSLSAFDVPHNLGTRDIITQVYSNTTYTVTSALNIQNTDTNTVSLSFDFIPTVNELRVVVLA